MKFVEIKNLITHFAWYLEKEKNYGIETLSVDGVSNKEHFHGKIMQKMSTKCKSQTPFVILLNNLKQPMQQEIYLKIKYFERGLPKKSLKS